MSSEVGVVSGADLVAHEEEGWANAHALDRNERGEERGLVDAAKETGQLLDRGSTEERCHREVPACLGAELSTDLGCSERVPAQVEEALVGADSLEAEHVLEQARDALFERATRAVADAATSFRQCRRGQRAAVELAVRIEGKCIEPHVERGNHVLGKRLGEPPTKHGGRDTRPGNRDQVRDELHLVAIALDRRHNGLFHVRQAEEGRFDLGRHDAAPPHLQHEVGAPQILEAAVDAHPSRVPRAVDTHSASFRIGVKGGLCEILASPVPGREVRAAHGDLADLPYLDLVARLVEQEDVDVTNRVADRQHAVVDLRLVVDEELARDAGLGRAEAVDEHAARLEVPPIEVDVDARTAIALEPDAAHIRKPGVAREEAAEDRGDGVIPS